jgi:hypothetical protein
MDGLSSWVHFAIKRHIEQGGVVENANAMVLSL